MSISVVSLTSRSVTQKAAPATAIAELAPDAASNATATKAAAAPAPAKAPVATTTPISGAVPIAITAPVSSEAPVATTAPAPAKIPVAQTALPPTRAPDAAAAAAPAKASVSIVARDRAQAAAVQGRAADGAASSLLNAILSGSTGGSASVLEATEKSFRTIVSSLHDGAAQATPAAKPATVVVPSAPRPADPSHPALRAYREHAEAA